MNHKILITGGAGFIGSCLADALIARGDCEVVIVDDLSTGYRRFLPGKPSPSWKFIKCDVNNFREISSIMLAYRFDFVFHYAAVVGVQRTLDNPVAVLKDVDGLHNILDLCKNTGVKRVFYSSSSEVYGEPVELPQNERTTPLNSRLPYAVVKNLGEAMLRAYFTEFDLEYTIFRFFNTYGSRQSPDFVISRFLDQALKGNEITVYGDGSQTRTFCYIDDNIEATIKACFENRFVNDVVNIGNDREITVLELAEKIIEVSNSGSIIRHLPPLPEGDMGRRQPDIEKMRMLLNRPLLSLEEGLLKTISAVGNSQSLER